MSRVGSTLGEKIGHPDPITVEIVRNALVAATEDMKTSLMRTAYNIIIYEALDFTVGLFNSEGEILSIGIGLPMFIRGMGLTVKKVIDHYGGLERIGERDVYVTNDAYTTGSHLNHVTLVAPIVRERKVVAFAVCMAHWEDIGGSPGTMPVDIYAEGLQIPVMRLYRDDQINEELLDIIRANVRNPDKGIGDLRAQIGAVRTGQRRFNELLDRYGVETIRSSVAAIFDHSEAAARRALRRIPNGVYEAESFLDDDGVTVGKLIPLKVRVVIEDERMLVDLTGISGQVKGFYNSGEAAGLSAAQVAFKCLVAGTEYPINDGCFRALEVILPKGTVVSAQRPAPMSWWMTYPMTVIDTVFKALSSAVPDRVIAGHYADLSVAILMGRGTDGKPFFYPSGVPGGGWGAKHNEDGMSATIPINDGDTHNSPIEQSEAKFPHLVERYALRADSAGPGTFRGGLGVEFALTALQDMRYSTAIERVECRPWGLNGGLSGSGNQVAVKRAGKEEVAYSTGKLFGQPLNAGDQICIRTGGGGGFGSPLERDVDRVLDDLRQGYISEFAARFQYGVVLGSDGLIANMKATRELRERMRAEELPIDTVRTSELIDEEGNARRRSLVASANQIENALHEEGVPWLWTRCC